MTTVEAGEALALMLDELWDLEDAFQELGARREKLRGAILDECRRQRIQRHASPRGTIRIERHLRYEAPRPGALVDILRTLRWEDDVLRVDGRALHAAAQRRRDTRAYFDATLRTVEEDALVLVPRWR